MKIYLAGPDVFFPNPDQWKSKCVACIEAAGHEALVPVDNEVVDSKGIYEANIKLLNQADAVVANLNPFRGFEPDSGTCFEVGYAIARGVKVIGYVSDGRSQADKLAISDGKGLGMRDGRPIDKNGHFVENFKHPVNLMLAKSCTEIVTGDMEKALALLWGHAV